MIIAIIIGSIVGVLLTFFVTRWLLRAIAIRLARRDEQRKFIKVLGGIFAAISIAPALFMAIMAGETLGRYDSVIAEIVGLGEIGPLIVLVVRIALFTPVTVAINAAIGAGLGALLARSLYPAPTA